MPDPLRNVTNEPYPYDQFWQWANKPRDGLATLSWLIHEPVMELAPEDRKDRAKVNEAVAGFDPKEKPDTRPGA